jgi:heme A synthase
VIVTVLVIATFIAVLRAVEDRRARRAAGAAVAAIGLQIALGALTVLDRNAGWTVAVHLAGAWLLLAATGVTATSVLDASRRSRLAAAQRRGGGPPAIARQGPQRASPPAPRVPGATGLATVAAVFLLGVSGMLLLHEGASRACESWPLCLGSTAASPALVLQYLHRSLALLASVLVCVSAVKLWHSHPQRPGGRVLAVALLCALASTAALGGIVATMGASALAEDIHLALASVLWIAVVLASTTLEAAPDATAFPLTQRGATRLRARGPAAGTASLPSGRVLGRRAEE